MNKFRKVSVVIPTHKRPGTLIRSLDSVFRQTYPCHEVIVVSDGLDLETDLMMKAMSCENPILKYCLVDPPQGGNHARNVGVKHASCSYIAFLDDDDEWMTDKIARQMKLIDEDMSIGLVCTASNIVDEDGLISRVNIPTAQYDAALQILHENCIGTTSSALIDRAVLDQSGVFDETLEALQDYELWIRICQVTKVGVVKEPSLVYYDNPFSTQISRNTQKYIEAYDKIFKKHKVLFLSQLGQNVFRLRKASSMLAISKRAKWNGQPHLARKYAHKAFGLGMLWGGVKMYLLSLVPLPLLTSLHRKLSRFPAPKKRNERSA